MNNAHLLKINVFPLWLVAGMLCLSGISGCGTTGISGGIKVRPDGLSENRVRIDNPFLSSNIMFSDLTTTMSGDLLVAHAAVTSKHNSTLTLQYKFRWYDALGIEIAADGSPWQPLMLYGGESKGLQAVAPNPDAKEFKIEVRYTK